MDIYTDGACHGSTKIGGIGVVFVKNNKIIYKFNKQFTDTTNNRMEILAIIYALHAISKPIDISKLLKDERFYLRIFQIHAPAFCRSYPHFLCLQALPHG